MLEKRPEEQVERFVAAPISIDGIPVDEETDDVADECLALLQLANYDHQATCAVDAYCANPFSRWWLQVGINGFRLLALHDSGAARTVKGLIELQITSAIGKSISPHRGARVRLANGQLAPILGHVELPSDAVGIRRYLDVIVPVYMDAECILGADFQRAFNAVLGPRENVLKIEGMSEPIQFKLVSFSLEELNTLKSIGLANADGAHHQ